MYSPCKRTRKLYQYYVHVRDKDPSQIILYTKPRLTLFINFFFEYDLQWLKQFWKIIKILKIHLRITQKLNFKKDLILFTCWGPQKQRGLKVGVKPLPLPQNYEPTGQENGPKVLYRRTSMWSNPIPTQSLNSSLKTGIFG